MACRFESGSGYQQWSVRISVSTLAFQAGKTGSTPVRSTKQLGEIMGEVVYVDFKQSDTILNECFNISPEFAIYLQSLRNSGICEDDILETIDAVNDLNFYLNSDWEIQKLARGWFHRFM